MLGSEILEVGLGLVIVFMLVSFIATAICEVLESWMKQRAVFLERGIQDLLADPTGEGLTRSFYEHPLIYSLYQGKYEFKSKRTRGDTLPSYIPARNFADTIIDLAIRGPVPSVYAAAHTSPDLSIASLRETVGRLQSPMVVRAVLTAADHANGDMTKLQANLQSWFDSAMDRVSGRYKRSKQRLLFFIGLGLAIGLNANAFRIADQLWRNDTLRQTIATRAEALARDTGYQRMLRDTAGFRKADIQRTTADLAALKLPIIWTDSAWTVARAASSAGFGRAVWFWFVSLLGVLPVAFAVTLGAPFWFDTLNKVMVIRSTVKPHEKSPEEGSEDRQRPASSVAGKSLIGSEPVSRGRIETTPAPETANRPGERGRGVNEWATGDADEGVI